MKFLQKYGMSIRIVVTVFLAVVLRSWILTGPAWSYYYNSNDLGPGGIGSPAQADTPVARSITEMEQLDRFKVERVQTDWNDHEGGVYLDGDYYELFTLQSGEQILIRYSLDGYEYDPGRDYWGSPIGTWRAWDLSEQNRAILAREAPSLTATDHYGDMMGGHRDALDKEKFAARYGIPCFFLCLIPVIALQVLWSRLRKNKMEVTRPRDNLERWLVGTYAIWGQFYAGLVYEDPDAAKKRPFYIGGVPRTEEMVRAMKQVLESDWDIRSYKDLLETVEYMSAGPGLWNCRSQGGRAWELCRSMQLLGCAFLVGWCDRKEMAHRSCEVGKTIQKTFQSWEELCQSFLEGYSQWRLSEGNSPAALAAVQQRADIYWDIRRRADSPYHLPWAMDLGKR